MQIIINEDEILEAIKEYISKQGIVTAGREVTVELTAGRGPNGARATIEIIKLGNVRSVHETYNPEEEKVVEKDEVEEPVLETGTDSTPEEPAAEATGVFELPAEETPIEEGSTDEPAEAVGGDSLFGY